MSREALNNLRDYIRLTLSPTDIAWLAAQIVEPIDKAAEPKPYTIEELHDQIAQSERDLAEGRFRDIEDLFQEWEKEDAVDYAAEPPAEYSSQNV